LTRIARNATGDASSAQVTFQNGKVTVTVTLPNPSWDVSSTQTVCKADVFNEMKALFTSRLNINEVEVTINGPVTDSYGNNTTGQYADADLTLATAQLFNWDNLDYDTAWNDYDSVWVIQH
jgi:hypothetical protein